MSDRPMTTTPQAETSESVEALREAITIIDRTLWGENRSTEHPAYIALKKLEAAITPSPTRPDTGDGARERIAGFMCEYSLERSEDKPSDLAEAVEKHWREYLDAADEILALAFVPANAEKALRDAAEALREIETICSESMGDCRRRMGTRAGNSLVVARAALAAISTTQREKP